MSEVSIARAADLAPISAPEPSAQPFWPKAVVALGLGLTAAWIVFIIFGIAKLIQLAT